METKLIKLTAKSEPAKYSFDDIYDLYKVFLQNEAMKYKRDKMFGDSMFGQDDIKQTFTLALYDAFKDYDYSYKTSFSTLLFYKMKGARSRIVGNRLQKRHGGYVDDNGDLKTKKTISLDIPQDENGDSHEIVDDSLVSEDYSRYIDLVDILRSMELKNWVEEALVNDFIENSFSGVATSANELSKRLGVSRQYISIVKVNLIKRIGKVLA